MVIQSEFSGLSSRGSFTERQNLLIRRADRIIFTLGMIYFLFCVALSTLNNTWNEALIFGGGNALVLILLIAAKKLKKKIRYLLGSILFFLISLLAFQMDGAFYVHGLFIVTPLVFVFYQEIGYLVSYFVLWISFSFLLFFSYKYPVINEFVSYITFDTWSFSTWISGVDVNSAFIIFYTLIIILTVSAISVIISTIGTENKKGIDDVLALHEKINLDQNTKLANQIAHGKYEEHYTLKNGDELGEALLTTRKSLRELQERDAEQKWLNSGLVSVNELLLYENKLKRLTNKVLRELIHFLNIQYGGLFIKQGEKDEAYLELFACYASNHRINIGEKVQIGEGLVGEAALRDQMIIIDKVPANYERIHTGLGDVLPKNIAIIPLTVKGQTAGVIELASVIPFEKKQIRFLNEISDNIAMSLISLISTETTNKLLNEAQSQSEQVKVQEEMMNKMVKEVENEKDNLKNQVEDANQELAIWNWASQQLEIASFQIEFQKTDEDEINWNLKSISKQIEQFTGKVQGEFINHPKLLSKLIPHDELRQINQILITSEKIKLKHNLKHAEKGNQLVETEFEKVSTSKDGHSIINAFIQRVY